jgi:hypothetical protein
MKHLTSFLVVAWAAAWTAVAQADEPRFPTRSWDKRVLEMRLKNVDVTGSSFESVLQGALKKHQLRASAYLTERLVAPGPVRIKKDSCTARELFDAIAAAFPPLTWTADPVSGIVWFHPAKLSLPEVLSQKVDLKKPLRGARMFTDVVEPVTTDLGVGVWMRGFSMRNTMDYTVDIPAGARSLRELLDICASANPMIHFIVSRYDGTHILAPANILADPPIPVPEGAIEFWRTFVNPQEEGEPSGEAVLGAISSQDAQIRWAGKYYLLIMHMKLPFYKWIKLPGREGMAAALVTLDVLVNDLRIASHRPALDRLRQGLTEEYLREGDPQFALLGALELARVGKDVSLSEKLLARPIPAEEIAPVESRVIRLLRETEGARDLLREKRPAWDFIEDAVRYSQETLVPSSPPRPPIEQPATLF